MANISTNTQELQAGALIPFFENKDGKRQAVWNKQDSKWHRVLYGVNQFGQQYFRNSVLPEDSWKALEAEVIRESSVPMSGVQHLRDAGLVITEPVWAVQHEWDVFSEMTAADITISGAAEDERDLPQTERKAITVPVVSKKWRLDFRELGAYNATGRSFPTDSAREAAQVVKEATENALFNGYGDVKLATASETYGYVNNPDTNTAASGGDWGTAGNAEATVTNIIIQLSADNFYQPFDLYVSQTQYDQIATLYSSADNNSTVFERIMAYPQVNMIHKVSSQFLADGSVLGVVKQANVVRWVESMPFSIVEWQSADGASTYWRVMTIAAPRTTGTYADRCGIVLSTGN